MLLLVANLNWNVLVSFKNYVENNAIIHIINQNYVDSVFFLFPLNET